MSVTNINDVSNQVQKYWSPMFQKELKEETLLPGLVNRDYEGDLKKGGDSVYVSQINRPTAELKTIGTDADSFESTKLSTSRVTVTADKRIVASYEFEDMVDLQSQIGAQNPAIRRALLEAVEIKLNDYLYSLVSPSTSAPDHSIASVADFNATQIAYVRKLASQAKWNKMKPWYSLLDPQYYSDLLAVTALTSRENGAEDVPQIAGRFMLQRFGFNIIEDNSDGILSLSPTAAGADCGLIFHPDFMYLVMGAPTFKVSDLHASKQFGYVISVDMWVGAKLGIDGDVKHIVVYNS